MNMLCTFKLLDVNIDTFTERVQSISLPENADKL